MKAILYMAISIDGKTTQGDFTTDWVGPEDIERMDSFMIQCGVMVMGSETFKSFGEDLPSDKALQVVFTNDENLLAKKQENVQFTNEIPKKVLESLEQKGFEKVLLAGGEKLNNSFLKDDLIDEIRVIVKPIVIGAGKSIFSKSSEIKRFKFIRSENLPNGSIELVFRKTK